MGPIVIHHIAEKTMKESKPAIVWEVGLLIAEMPFTDHAGVITSLVHKLW